ncbi:MAG: SDR family NAD(P)-dependent oxidoreductase [Proteobacteria bacterium]|nr:SDR family NAD(P)-dependent oxidoreductase [Pseudomonadota bacterium]
MHDFTGRVAVITGGASGIGKALGERAVAEGMKVVLADVEEAPLALAAAEIGAGGAPVLPVVTDVTSTAQVESLAERAFAEYGQVNLLCNNAGVFCAGSAWECSDDDWRWVFDVNVFGVANCLRAFIPRMIASSQQGYVINTSSMAGLTSMPFVAAYHASKHAVVAMSECLHHELSFKGADIRVSVLCPEAVTTNINSASRNRPASRADIGVDGGERQVVADAMDQAMVGATSAAAIAERSFEAARAERFYVLPGDDPWVYLAHRRMADLRDRENPAFVSPDQVPTDPSARARVQSV